MSSAEFPASLLRLIRSSVPTFAAAELLVFLCRSPVRGWAPHEISREMWRTAIATPALLEYLALFTATGLVREGEDGHFEYAPASADLQEAVGELTRAYNERPVTLIRTIYSIADLKIQSFADAFRLKPKQPDE